MSDGPFYVQCLSGNPDHIKEAVPGSELEVRCKDRAKAGFIDALRLSYDECPDCVEDSRELARKDAAYIDFAGCPLGDLDGKCADSCSCKNRREVADSPYANQLRHIAAIV